MMTPAKNKSPLDSNLTDCILQLSERATELGEKNTAIVLKVLGAHRLTGVDIVMAAIAVRQGAILEGVLLERVKKAAEGGKLSEDEML